MYICFDFRIEIRFFMEKARKAFPMVRPLNSCIEFTKHSYWHREEICSDCQTDTQTVFTHFMWNIVFIYGTVQYRYNKATLDLK